MPIFSRWLKRKEIIRPYGSIFKRKLTAPHKVPCLNLNCSADRYNNRQTFQNSGSRHSPSTTGFYVDCALRKSRVQKKIDSYTIGYFFLLLCTTCHSFPVPVTFQYKVCTTEGICAPLGPPPTFFTVTTSSDRSLMVW
ncbi:hypothetical protein NPIL_532371 [Nephila pilipes]|uniref:Uncharacterized protein n=1 Tax=Nephila pilipes TaxID=299642 RepID=A0A8X6QHJ3_NEPPI|nr:hypothetical protein NPIL_532371 [Nephila pilipes]